MTDRDEGPPGLQPERTLLAWNRTLLATVVVAGLLVRLVGPPLARGVHLPALLVGAVVLGLFVASERRYRHAVGRRRVVPVVQPLVLAAAVVGMGVVAVVVLLAP